MEQITDPKLLTLAIVGLAQQGLPCSLCGLCALLQRLRDIGLTASMDGEPDMIRVNGFTFDAIGKVNSDEPVWQVITE